MPNSKKLEMCSLTFASLSIDEPSSRCISDPRARDYVADHAADLLGSLADDLIDYDQEHPLWTDIRSDLILEMRGELDDDDQLLDAIELCEAIGADARHQEAAQKIGALLAQIHAYLNDDD